MATDIKNRTRSFVMKFLVLTAIFIGAIAVFNLAVDPAGVHGLVEIKGFNAEKTELMAGGGRRDKADVLGHGGFENIILGTSRSEIGLDPLSPVFEGRPTYNASLAGAYVYEIERAFSYASEHNDLKRVVLSLDFFTFYGHMGGVGDFDESGFASGEAAGALSLAKRLITLDELTRSFDTLKDNLSGKKAAYTRFGRRLEIEGQVKRTSALDVMRKTFVKSVLYVSGSYDPSGMELIRSIIAACRASDIELVMFISPVHALQLENIRLAGAYPAYEDWKRSLAKLVDEDAVEHPGLKPIALWDFSGYNSITAGDFPEPDYAAKDVKWYWEPGHYKKEVGDMILGRMFKDGLGAPDDFGRLVDGKNIEARLAGIRAERERYHNKRPGFINALERLWKETAEERKASLARGEEPETL
jgi:hypothetical protein